MIADATALLLARAQFAFTMAFHIVFPAFSIGHANDYPGAMCPEAWLVTEILTAAGRRATAKSRQARPLQGCARGPIRRGVGTDSTTAPRG